MAKRSGPKRPSRRKPRPSKPPPLHIDIDPSAPREELEKVRAHFAGALHGAPTTYEQGYSITLSGLPSLQEGSSGGPERAQLEQALASYLRALSALESVQRAGEALKRGRHLAMPSAVRGTLSDPPAGTELDLLRKTFDKLPLPRSIIAHIASAAAVGTSVSSASSVLGAVPAAEVAPPAVEVAPPAAQGPSAGDLTTADEQICLNVVSNLLDVALVNLSETIKGMVKTREQLERGAKQ